jgi:MYXO-CTERM domain-containing protein
VRSVSARSSALVATAMSHGRGYNGATTGAEAFPMRSSRFLIVLSSLLGLVPQRALAWCQATTGAASAACPSACSSAGVPVHWGTRDIEYAFNGRGFPGLDQTAVRNAVGAAFAAWAEVPCGGHPLGFRFFPLSMSTDLTVGPATAEPNLNVISLLTPAEWQREGFGASEFARTKLWYDEKTGEILGADIAFNPAVMPLSVCPDRTSCGADAIDLQNVVTHELGHFLGLAHSEDLSATMWCAAQRGDHEKRTLADDDEAGLCAIYKNGGAFIDNTISPATVAPSTAGDDGGCAVRSSGAGSAPWLLVLLIFGWRTRKKAFA